MSQTTKARNDPYPVPYRFQGAFEFSSDQLASPRNTLCANIYSTEQNPSAGIFPCLDLFFSL